jgi:hypothetical protein
MRSIRVGGHTHSWVVDSFLREQEIQQEEQAQKSRQGTVQQKRPYCTDFRIPYSRKKGTKTEAESTVRTVRIPYSPYDCYFGTDFEERRCVVFWKFWHISQGGRTTFIALFWAEAVGTNFKVTVQHFGGTEIEEQTCNLLGEKTQQNFLIIDSQYNAKR